MGSASKPSPSAAAPSRRKVALCLTLLTLQYGAQPLISKRCVGYAAHLIYHLALKFILCSLMLGYSGINRCMSLRAVPVRFGEFSVVVFGKIFAKNM